MIKKIFIFILIFQYFGCYIDYINNKYMEGKFINNDEKLKIIFKAFNTTNYIFLPPFKFEWEKKKIKNFNHYQFEINTKCKNLIIKNINIFFVDTLGKIKFKETYKNDIDFNKISSNLYVGPKDGIYTFNLILTSKLDKKLIESFLYDHDYSWFLLQNNELKNINLCTSDTLIINYDYFDFKLKSESAKISLNKIVDKMFEIWSIY